MNCFDTMEKENFPSPLQPVKLSAMAINMGRRLNRTIPAMLGSINGMACMIFFRSLFFIAIYFLTGIRSGRQYSYRPLPIQPILS